MASFKFRTMSPEISDKNKIDSSAPGPLCLFSEIVRSPAIRQVCIEFNFELVNEFGELFVRAASVVPSSPLKMISHLKIPRQFPRNKERDSRSCA